ncbi:MAG TPA: hypothetical protein VJA66_17375 [Thermoanaerobaculia bacterium]
MKTFLGLHASVALAMLGAVVILVLLLVVSFRSRVYVFCQYLKTMTGIALKPREVKAAFRRGGKEGVRELFLDLIIREDLKGGPAKIPEDAGKVV